MTLTPQEIAAGWIPHDGGPNPVPGKLVEMKLSNGCNIHAATSNAFIWKRRGIIPSIIAYRLADTEEDGIRRRLVNCIDQWDSEMEYDAEDRAALADDILHEFNGPPLTTPPPEPNTSAEPVGDGGMREDRFYIDCEFDGHAGQLLSIALVCENGRSIHIRVDTDPMDIWVRKNVLPIMDNHDASESATVYHDRVGDVIKGFIGNCQRPVIIADSPVDIGRFCRAISTGQDGGWSSTDYPLMTFEVHNVDCYPTDLPGAVQHNAWWDAMALRHRLAAQAPVVEGLEIVAVSYDKWPEHDPLVRLSQATRLLAEKDKEVERWHSAFDTAADQAMANGARALAAEARVTELESYAKDVAKECLAERARANKAEAEVEKLREVLEPLVEIAESVTDEGPDGEGWKSHKLLTLISDARQALAPEDR